MKTKSTKIASVMTPAPHTIGRDQSLATAHALMREHGIRHLPVLEGGKLVGLLSERDLHFVETLRDVDPASAKVEEAMSSDVYVTSAGETLEEVAAHMAEHKIGSAVVLEAGHVVGIFTTNDALRVIAGAVSAGRAVRTA